MPGVETKSETNQCPEISRGSPQWFKKSEFFSGFLVTLTPRTRRTNSGEGETPHVKAKSFRRERYVDTKTTTKENNEKRKQRRKKTTKQTCKTS